MQPLSYTRIVQPRVPSDDDALAQRTLAERSKLLAGIRQKISGGGEASARVQLAHEISQNKHERDELLRAAGIAVPHEAPAAEVLAVKADLAIPWNRLRSIRRYVHQTYTYISCL